MKNHVLRSKELQELKRMLKKELVSHNPPSIITAEEKGQPDESNSSNSVEGQVKEEHQSTNL